MSFLRHRTCRNAVACTVTATCLGLLLPAGSALAQEEPTPEQVEQADRAAKGQAALERARALMQEGRWDQARLAYLDALIYLPGNEEAQTGVSEAMRMLNQGDGLEDVVDTEKIIGDRTRVEFDAAVRTANELAGQNNFAGARREILDAKIRLDNNRQYLVPAEYQARAEQADRMLAAITTQEEAHRRQVEIETQDEAERLIRDAEIQAEKARQKQITEHLQRVRTLQMEQKYEEALQVIDQILFLDPRNPSALTLQDVFLQQLLLMDYVKNDRRHRYGVAKQWVENKAAMTPPTDIMEYPEDWPAISLRRSGAEGWRESADDRRVFQVLTTQRIPIDFNGNTFEEVVGFLKQVTGLNIYADWKALDLIGVQRDDQITLQLQNVTVGTALERILEQYGNEIDRPDSTVQDGVLMISSEEALRKRTATIVYDIRDLIFEVPYFDNAPNLNLDQALQQGGGGGGGGGGGRGGGGGGGGFGGGGGGGGGSIFGEPGEAERRAREELIDQIVNIIQDNVDPDGWSDRGGDTGRLQELNGNLIITNTPGNHRQIEGLLAQLREIRAIQINVEGRFLSVSVNWFEQIGFDLDLYFNTNKDVRNQQLAADPLAHLSDFFNPGGTLRDPLIYGDGLDDDGEGFGIIPFGSSVGVPVTPTSFANGNPNFQDLQYVVGPPGAPIRTTQGFTPIGVTQNSYAPGGTGMVNELAEFSLGSFAGIAAGLNPALSFGVQFLDDVQVDLLIEATQADRRSIVLTAPRLTFFNGQRSWVSVGTQTLYVTGLDAVTGDGAVAFEPEIDTITEGAVLDVEAVVSADRRYVTMTVIASLSEIIATRQIGPFGAGVGGIGGAVGEGGGAATLEASFDAPVIAVQLVNTTVSVPDKGTVLLGGQREVREIEVEAGVPVLSKIPFINRFFTNRVTSKDESTLLILIRPEIIIQQEREDLLYPGLADQLGGAAAFMR